MFCSEYQKFLGQFRSKLSDCSAVSDKQEQQGDAGAEDEEAFVSKLIGLSSLVEMITNFEHILSPPWPSWQCRVMLFAARFLNV